MKNTWVNVLFHIECVLVQYSRTYMGYSTETYLRKYIWPETEEASKWVTACDRMPLLTSVYHAFLVVLDWAKIPWLMSWWRNAIEDDCVTIQGGLIIICCYTLGFWIDQVSCSLFVDSRYYCLFPMSIAVISAGQVIYRTFSDRALMGRHIVAFVLHHIENISSPMKVSTPTVLFGHFGVIRIPWMKRPGTSSCQQITSHS